MVIVGDAYLKPETASTAREPAVSPGNHSTNPRIALALNVLSEQRLAAIEADQLQHAS
jgi:hypothetical protein